MAYDLWSCADPTQTPVGLSSQREEPLKVKRRNETQDFLEIGRWVRAAHCDLRDGAADLGLVLGSGGKEIACLRGTTGPARGRQDGRTDGLLRSNPLRHCHPPHTVRQVAKDCQVRSSEAAKFKYRVGKSRVVSSGSPPRAWPFLVSRVSCPRDTQDIDIRHDTHVDISALCLTRRLSNTCWE